MATAYVEHPHGCSTGWWSLRAINCYHNRALRSGDWDFVAIAHQKAHTFRYEPSDNLKNNYEL